MAVRRNRGKAFAKANRSLNASPHQSNVLCTSFMSCPWPHRGQEELCVNGNQYWGGFGRMRRGVDRAEGMLSHTSRRIRRLFVILAECSHRKGRSGEFQIDHSTISQWNLSPFQVISLEGWTDVLYFVQDAHSFWNWIYFVLLIVVSERE